MVAQDIHLVKRQDTAGYGGELGAQVEVVQQSLNCIDVQQTASAVAQVQPKMHQLHRPHFIEVEEGAQEHEAVEEAHQIQRGIPGQLCQQWEEHGKLRVRDQLLEQLI